MKRFIFFMTALLFMVSLISQEYRVVPNHGHLGEVTAMEIDGKRDTLITLGADNSCLVTDLKNNRVINRFPFEGELIKHALNPQYPELSLITEYDGDYNLTAYNWQSGEILFTEKQESSPFFLEYSQSGDILMFGNYSAKVKMIDHGNGSALKGPDLISSLLTYGYMGGSAKTFMGYNPSGQIIYYDRNSSQVKGNVTTLNDLTNLNVLQSDIQLMTARKENSIYLINRQTGQENDSLSFEKIISHGSSPFEGTQTLLYEEEGEIKITLLSVSRGKFKRQMTRTLDSEEKEVSTAGYEKRLFIGTRSGDILTAKSSGQFPSLFPQKKLEISELAMGNNRLITGADKAIWEWESPFFEKDNLDFNYILKIRRRLFTPPYTNIKLAAHLNEGVLWSQNKSSREDFFLFSENSLDLFYTAPPVEEEAADFFKSRNEKQEGLALLSYLGNREILFLWDKTCLINNLNLVDGEIQREEIYRYNHPSLETAAMISNELLILGKNTYYGGNSSINIINVITGETLFMEENREVITQILPIDGEGHFYSLGYKKEDGINFAIIREHKVTESHVSSKDLYSYEEEITNLSRISLSGEESSLLLKKSSGQWLKINQTRIEEALISSQSDVLSHRGYLYLISPDHSLIIMNEKNMTPLARVIIFEDGQWLALSLVSNYYFHSKEARDLFSVFKLE